MARFETWDFAIPSITEAAQTRLRPASKTLNKRAVSVGRGSRGVGERLYSMALNSQIDLGTSHLHTGAGEGYGHRASRKGASCNRVDALGAHM